MAHAGHRCPCAVQLLTKRLVPHWDEDARRAVRPNPPEVEAALEGLDRRRELLLSWYGPQQKTYSIGSMKQGSQVDKHDGVKVSNGKLLAAVISNGGKVCQR